MKYEMKQFINSKRVCNLWLKVKNDVIKVLPTEKVFLEAFKN
jgi:hypothetical protein